MHGHMPSSAWQRGGGGGGGSTPGGRAGFVPHPAAAAHTPGGGGGGPGGRVLLLSSSMLHIISVPLLILASMAVGFLLVYLKEVLLPFVIGGFLVYLLRPLVNLLTTPFAKCCGCCMRSAAVAAALPVRTRVSRTPGSGSSATAAYTRLGTVLPGGGGGGSSSSSGGGGGVGSSSGSSVLDATDDGSAGGSGVSGTGAAAPLPSASRRRPASPPKYSRGLRTHVARATNTLQSWLPTTSAMPVTLSTGASIAGGGSAQSASGGVATEERLMCCGSACRFQRCPRWFAILVALAVAGSVVAGLVLLIVDAIQRFHQESLAVYIFEAGKLADDVQRWLSLFGIYLEAGAVLDVIKQHISVYNVVQATLTIIADGIGNMIIIMLLVLYLLAEQSQHAPTSLRAKVDNQIQRYVVIKTVISAGQGLLVFFILSYILNVRMAHLFGVLHFFMNYIPTAGPIIATFVPLPIVILDPDLGITAKIAAFAAPTAVHMLVGNCMEPMVFGSSMELHPVTILLSLALWYALWGIPGAILAVPITAVMRIVLSSSDHPYARIIINLMEGRLSAATAEIDDAIDGSASSFSHTHDLEVGMTPSGAAFYRSSHFVASGVGGGSGLGGFSSGGSGAGLGLTTLNERAGTPPNADASGSTSGVSHLPFGNVSEADDSDDSSPLDMGIGAGGGVHVSGSSSPFLSAPTHVVSSNSAPGRRGGSSTSSVVTPLGPQPARSASAHSVGSSGGSGGGVSHMAGISAAAYGASRAYQLPQAQPSMTLTMGSSHDASTTSASSFPAAAVAAASVDDVTGHV